MSGLKARVPVQNTGGFLSSKVQAVYDRMLLERAVDSQLFDVGAQVKSIPANSNTLKKHLHIDIKTFYQQLHQLLSIMVLTLKHQTKS